jgi:hypothetical protein
MVAFTRKKRAVPVHAWNEPEIVPLLNDGDMEFVVQLCLLTNVVLPHGLWPFLKRPEVTELQERLFREHHRHIGWPAEFLDLGPENVSRLAGLKFGTQVKGDNTELCIEALLLEDRNVQGRLPAEIGNLKHLQEINLQNNQFVGGIPEAIGGCCSLCVLNMSYNNLSGDLPASIGGLQRLEVLRVYQNRLTGFLPNTLDQAPALTEIMLGRNKLQGGYKEEDLRCTIKADCRVLTTKIAAAAAAARAATGVAALAAAAVAALQVKTAALVAALVGACAAVAADGSALQAERSAYRAEWKVQAACEEGIMLRMGELRGKTPSSYELRMSPEELVIDGHLASPEELSFMVQQITHLVDEFGAMAWLTAPPPRLERKPRKSKCACLLKQMEASAWLAEATDAIELPLRRAAAAAEAVEAEKRRLEAEVAAKAESKMAKARRRQQKEERAAAKARKHEEEQDAVRAAHVAKQKQPRTRNTAWT